MPPHAQVRTSSGRDDTLHQVGAPVVTDEVDGRAQPFDLTDGEVDVGFLGRTEPRRAWTTEPGQRQRDRLPIGQAGADRVPEVLRVRDAVDEDHAHAGRLGRAASGSNRVDVPGTSPAVNCGPSWRP
jgi:hypothetical protein